MHEAYLTVMGSNADGAHVNLWVYRVGQGQASLGVTHSGPMSVWIGAPAVPLEGGPAACHFREGGWGASVGFQCHAGVSLPTALLNPCPPNPHPQLNIHYALMRSSPPSFPLPSLMQPQLPSHGPVRSQALHTLVHCSKCHLSYTPPLSTDAPLFIALL